MHGIEKWNSNKYCIDGRGVLISLQIKLAVWPCMVTVSDSIAKVTWGGTSLMDSSWSVSAWSVFRHALVIYYEISANKDTGYCSQNSRIDVNLPIMTRKITSCQVCLRKDVHIYCAYHDSLPQNLPYVRTLFET